MRLVRIGPKLSGAQILDYEGEDTLFSAEIEDFGHSKFLGILKDLFSKRSLSPVPRFFVKISFLHCQTEETVL
jgi:hypothetical protein